MKPNSFTLIELVIVIAILAILSAVVLLVMNPAEYMKSARDSSRMSDIQTIHKAVGLYQADGGTSMGSSSVVYVSIPDSSATCGNLGLPALPAGWNYSCSTSANYRKTDGTGWIPVHFSDISFTSPLSSLPTDPINTTSTGNYYTYVTGGSWSLTALFETTKYQDIAINDGDSYPGVYSLGTDVSLTPGLRDMGLVGYWKFDETSGTTVYDSSGYKHHGTLVNSPVLTTGKIGNGLYYNTSGSPTQYVSLPVFSLSGTALSISFWVKNSTSSYHQTFLGDANQSASAGFLLTYRESGSAILIYQYALGSTYSNASSPNFFADINNSWALVTIVADYSGKNVYFYKNGSLFNRISMITPIFPSTVRAKYIGIYASGAHPLVNSYLDDFRIYNRVLSASEISAIYNATNK